VIFLFFMTQLFASVLTLEQVHQQVLKDMPLIMEAEEKLRAARGNLQSMEGAFDFTIKAKSMNQFESKYDNQYHDAHVFKQNSLLGSRMYLGHRAGTGKFPDYYGGRVTTSVGEMYAGIEIPLLRDREMDSFRLNRLRASRGVDYSQVEVHQKSLDILLKSSQVYWKWVASGQKLRVLLSWVKAAEARQEFLERKVKAGDTSEIRLTDNRRSLAKRKSEVVKGEREFTQASQELFLYIRSQSPIEMVPKEIALTEEPLNIVDTQSRDTLPVFRLLNIEKDILKFERELAISQTLPDLSLGVEGSRELGGGTLPLVREDPDQLRVGLKIEIPIENRKARGKFREVRGKMGALEQRSLWLEREWKTVVGQNRVGLTTTREQLTLLESEVADTVRMARAEEGRLKQGDGDVFFVNIREQDEAEARLRMIETRALHEFLIAERFSLDGTWAQIFLNREKN
jgi:outer membrane protein TolC